MLRRKGLVTCTPLSSALRAGSLGARGPRLGEEAGLWTRVGPQEDRAGRPQRVLSKEGLSPPWERGDPLGRNHSQGWSTLPPSTLGWWHKTRLVGPSRRTGG